MHNFCHVESLPQISDLCRHPISVISGKLYEMNPSAHKKLFIFYFLNYRHDQIVYTRCRLGQSRLIQVFFIKR